MKIGRIPLIHLAKLRQQAGAANCPGVVQYINTLPALFAARRSSSSDLSDVRIIGGSDDINPELDAAFDELQKLIEERFTDPKYQPAPWEDDDFVVPILQSIIGTVELVPTLPLPARALIDACCAKAAA